jgi:hypothetical protein
MQQSTNPQYPNIFLLLVNNYPPGQGIFFRAVASLAGSVDSISNASRAPNLTSDTPPAVTVQPPAGLAGSGDGHDLAHPILIASGGFHFGATVQSSRSIAKLKLKFDGSTVAEFNNGASSGGTDYTANAIGDHVLEAFAIDDLGATARAGTDPVYIRVLPAGSGSVSKRTSASSISGHTYTAVTDGYWENQSTWQDEKGVPGVPGSEDIAVINGKTINLSSGKTVGAVSMVDAILLNLTATRFDFTVLRTLSVSGASLQGSINIEIDGGAKWLLLNSSNVEVDPGVVIENRGTMKIRGNAGLVGAQSITNKGVIDFGIPIGPARNAAADPAAAVRQIQANSITNAGVITGNVSSYISTDGASFVASDGASFISSDSASLIGQDAAGLIGQDGSGLKGHDGASLRSSEGAGFISDNGAAGPVLSSSTNVKAASASSASSGYVQSGGETDLSHVVIFGSVALNGGSLTGSRNHRGRCYQQQLHLTGPLHGRDFDSRQLHARRARYVSR